VPHLRRWEFFSVQLFRAYGAGVGPTLLRQARLFRHECHNACRLGTIRQ
jgi:hypothetical protein